MKLFVFSYVAPADNQTEYISANNLEMAKLVFKRVLKRKGIMYHEVIRVTEYDFVKVHTTGIKS